MTLSAVAELLTEEPPARLLDDANLIARAQAIETVGRIVDALRTDVAGEFARRSDRSLGHDGLAAQLGFRTPAELLTTLTKVSGREADRRLRVGSSELAPHLISGSIDSAAASSIDTALSSVAGRVPPADLTMELDRLIDLATSAPADEVARAARSARDRLDARGISEREHELHARRYLRIGRAVNGLTPLHAMLAPEEAAVVISLFDSRTSVRRAVRFENEPPISRDDRTMDQRRADTLVDVCRIAAGHLSTEAGDSALARGAGTVVVTIALDQLDGAAGTARLDGHSEPLSAGAVRRLACNAGLLPIVLGAASQPLDLGHARRLFSAGQRRALGLRDHGCAAPHCDAPPGWTEAHHIRPWSRGGPTDLANGVLLCSFHHHQVHDGRFSITMVDGRPVFHRPEHRVPAAEGRPASAAERRRSTAAEHSASTGGEATREMEVTK